MRPPRCFLSLILLVLPGCTRPPASPGETVPHGNLHAFGVRGRPDATEHGARVVPAVVQEDHNFGAEPGGGVRSIAAGVRVVLLPNGAMQAAEDRLPQSPILTLPLPDRMGGGFLFVIGSVVWRADRWLSAARPIFASPSPLSRATVGLDRVYLRAQSGSHQAIDPRTGARLDLGPWPGSSFVGPYAALDGWRAVAVTDLRGVVATFDAGANWKPLGLAIDPNDVAAVGDAMAVSGYDAAHQQVWYEVRRDGQVALLRDPPMVTTTGPAALASIDPAARPFGRHPLLAAIEDGWPLVDGTAVVARDGALARVRLSDGAIVDLAPNAFSLKPSRCHPVPFDRGGAALGFGFLCGEPRGRTTIYAYDPEHARLDPVRSFDAPRVVTSSGNGSLVVRGGCAPDDPSEGAQSGQQSYCVFARDSSAASTAPAWREVRLHGEVQGARVVALRDGRVAVVSPPHGDLATARVTVLDGDRSTTHAIGFTLLQPVVAHTLKIGLWLEGFEERRPGVLGGWVEAGGAVVGMEVALDGHGRVGEYVRDAGAPFVSGQYGLGWTASRRGYETIDGGMTWTPIDLPEPIAHDHGVAVRACGPLGCEAAGWLRIGWGASATPEPPAAPPAVHPAFRRPPSLQLDCEIVAAPPAPSESDSRSRTTEREEPTGRRSSTQPPPLSFYSTPPPVLHGDDVALAVDVNEPIERIGHGTPLGRLYAWGSRAAEWAHAARWAARWVWPYAGSQDVRSTQPAPAPYANLEIARRALGVGAVPVVTWSMGTGDDAAHALLFGRHTAPLETTVLELESDRALAEIRRADGEPFQDIHSAMRAGGHWYLLTPQGSGQLPATVVWRLDGPLAHEVARVPRAGFEGNHPPPPKLARRADGRAIGVVVDGEPPSDRTVPLRWVVPVDVESGELGEPEPLGASDLGDRSDVPLCVGGDENGWVLDTAWGASARLYLSSSGGAKSDSTQDGNLYNLYARLHLSRETACVERLAGSYESIGAELHDLLRSRHARPAGPGVSVAAWSSERARYPLRCVKR